MAEIYSEQAVTQPQQQLAELVDTKQVNSFADSLINTKDTELENYKKQANNLGESTIQQAYIQFPDNPQEFDKAVKGSMNAIESQIIDNEAKVEFKANMMLKREMYNTKVMVNNQDKVDLQNKNVTQEEATFSLDDVKENLSLVYLNNGASGAVKARIGKLNELSQKKDSNGNYLLTLTQRGVIKDIVDNPQYYGALSYADRLKATENLDGLELEYNKIKNNKAQTMKSMGLTEDKYTKLLESFKPSNKEDSVGSVTATVAIETMINDLQIKDGVVGNDKYDKQDLYSLITDLDKAYAKKQVTKSFYIKNMVDLKGTYYNDSKKLFEKKGGFMGHWQKETAGVNALDYVETVAKPFGDNIKASALKFDITKIVLDEFVKKGIDPESTDPSMIKKSNDTILELSPSIMKFMYPKASKEDLKTDKGQKKVIAQAESVATSKKVNNILGLNALDSLDWNNNSPNSNMVVQ